jgi:hypothetical protein
MAFSTYWPRLRRGGSSSGRQCGDHFSAAEVRQVLTTTTDHAGDPVRRGAVLAVAALTGDWTTRVDRRLAWELGRLAERLPTVVYLFTSGASPDEVRARLGTLSSATAERAFDAACACIAAQLNAARVPGARVREGGEPW